MEIIQQPCSRRNIKIQQFQGMAENFLVSITRRFTRISFQRNEQSHLEKEVGVRFSWLADCLPPGLRRIGPATNNFQ